MEEISKHDSAWDNLKRHWVSSLGVQAWLVDTTRAALSERLRRLLEQIEPQTVAERGPMHLESASGLATGDVNVHSIDGLGGLMETLRLALVQLDDVKDYAIVEALDNQMYQLWKELERTMQRHRRSEARYQLKEMFRI